MENGFLAEMYYNCVHSQLVCSAGGMYFSMRELLISFIKYHVVVIQPSSGRLIFQGLIFQL